MLSIYQLKPRFQNLLRPLVRRLHTSRVTANQVTLTALVLSVLVAAVVAWQPEQRWVFLLVPLWMLLRMAFNAIDGMLAREFGQQSRLGAYLNELSDVAADSALYLPFALVAGVWPAVVIAVVLLAAISEYAGVLGLMVGASRRYDGPMGKSDRAFAFGVIATGISCGLLSAVWINALLLVIAALSLLTLVNRVQRGLKEGQATRQL
ncbi:CDP-alcohol phosphatidyltransferase family protein [Pseudomonas sp. SST3]|uniref:CDP-alcohol phosphatidyltransferase family protein n=1 Tax=Pseudomonas sp. SST3 TaxID=2267882 RepID=UPI000DF87F63|nr:CDP-alcohol phosphatidyltransferase family protein [Pseudomonas sp. SST3]NKQ13079.1 CDP-alcohol phosphatidyltransferase family protein [Pseudomonas sp. SST3]